MKSRRGVWALVGIVAVVGAGYVALNPPMPVSFLGSKPNVRFLTGAGKPWFDAKVPILGRLTYPAVGKVVTRDTPAESVAGYLDWSRESFDEPVYWRAGDLKIPSTYATLANYNYEFLELPFATDAKFAEVDLVRGVKAYKMSLPVKPDPAAAMPKDVEIPAGSSKIRIRQLPRRLSNAPLYLELTTDAPAGKEFMIHPQWGTARIDPVAWGVESGKTTYVRINREVENPNLSGTVMEVKRTMLNVVCTRTTRHGLWLLDESRKYVLWGKLRPQDQLAYVVNGNLLSNKISGIQSFEPRKASAYIFDKVVQAESIKIVKSWPIEPKRLALPRKTSIRTYSGMLNDRVTTWGITAFNPFAPQGVGLANSSR